MYCPTCGDEYRAGFTICSDCQVALVPGAPAGKTTPKETAPDISSVDADEFGRAEPVCVLIEAAIIDAEITVNALRSHGVRAFASGTGMEVMSEAGAIGQMTRVRGPLNEIRIMVHPDDVERAHEIIDFAAAAVDDREPPHIPGEDAVWRVDKAKRKRVLRTVALFLLVPLLLTLAYEAVFALDLFAGLFD